MADSSRELLDAAYSELGYVDGELLSAAADPTDQTSAVWVEKGDWLALATKVGAEKVFFVDNYPVIVFAEQSTPDPEEWLNWFNSVWCMARPQLLFLARDGELVVFNLNKRPARQGEDRDSHERLLQIVNTVAEVQEKLAQYRRDQVESGLLFGDDVSLLVVRKLWSATLLGGPRREIFQKNCDRMVALLGVKVGGCRSVTESARRALFIGLWTFCPTADVLACWFRLAYSSSDTKRRSTSGINGLVV